MMYLYWEMIGFHKPFTNIILNRKYNNPLTLQIKTIKSKLSVSYQFESYTFIDGKH